IFVTTVMFVILFATFKPEIEHRTPASQSDSLHHINPVVQEGDTSFLIHNENVQIRRNGTMNMGYSNEDSTYEAYLLRQQSLLPSQRDNMLMKFFVKKIFELGDKYADTESLDELFLEKWLHNIPKVFFILLPWFALVLSWFFRKSGLFYVDHLIFSVHTHVVLFIVLTLRHLIDLIPIMQKVSDFYNLLAFGGILLYIVLSLRRVYGNGILKTVFKMVALNLLYLIGFFITSLIILFFTFFSL
ncbi:MAG TPA: hypothetical protein PLP14_07800, partial [Chitinophagaceae bacterium]|nr:hypothetical protein [Chitinophagaceae bacterium]